jgi:hypothetical protein
MKDIVFTAAQVQQIINTLLPIAAKDCFDTLLMIKTEIDKQQTQTSDATN